MKKCSTRKILFFKVMKLCSLQGLLAVMLVSVSAAHPNYAQLLDKKISISFHETPLKDALKKIEVLGDIKFFYSPENVDLKQTVTVEAIDEPLKIVLRRIFDPLRIEYNVREKDASVTLRTKSEEEGRDDRGEDQKSFDKSTESHLASITGIVTDAATGQPMAGVNVIVKGTVKGTSTDSDGRYVIEAISGESLVFSFIGFKTVEIRVNNSMSLDVKMDPDTKTLEAIEINAGYWKVTNAERTGNITKVSAAEIQRQPVSNPIAALQGRVAGLQIIQQTGLPGGNFTVRIRGQNSISNGNDPLYIIDGVPYFSSSLALPRTAVELYGANGTSPLDNLNPSDIESIEILKDADATAIYGSRGANGVVLITTKRGKEGNMTVDLKFSTGAGKMSSKTDLLQTKPYLQMRHEAFDNDGITPSMANAPDLLVWDTTRYTDWQKTLLGETSSYNDAQLSVSGGNQMVQYVFGGGYHRETTVFPGANNSERTSAHILLTSASKNQKLKTTVSASYSRTLTNLPGIDLTPQALTLPPNAPELFIDGELNWTGWTSARPNPLSYTLQKYNATSNFLTASAVVEYSILPDLKVKANLGNTMNGMEASRMTPIASLAPSVRPTASNAVVFSRNTLDSWIAEPQLNWDKRKDNHQLNIVLGASFMNQITEGGSLVGEGFTSEALMEDLGSAATIKDGGSHYSKYRYNAIFSRINYVLMERYILNVTGRRDGSSRFGPGNKFANFGAIGAAWIFSKEGFMSNALPFLSFGKLRTSYGVTGNDQIGDYQYLDSFTASNPYQGVVGLRPVRLHNPNFAWETNRKFETGIELAFLTERVLYNLSYFNNRSANQLVGNPLPPTTGFGRIQSNLPAIVENTGIEMDLNTINVRNEEFTWTTSFNVTIPKNRLLEFPNIAAAPEYANTLVVGEPLTIKKLYHYLGVDALTGLYVFDDVDKNNVYNVNDRQTAKFIGPKYYGGLNNTFQFKGIQLDIFFQFVKQTGYNFVDYGSSAAPGNPFNHPTQVLNRWQQEGDITDIQKFSTTSTAQTQYSLLKSSDQIVSDASFIRLKNISLSYSVPKSFIDKLRMVNLRVFLQGQNILTVTNYDGLDPENQARMLPPLRMLTGGFNMTF